MLNKFLVFVLAITITNKTFAEKNPVVAKVNGKKITLNELNTNYNNAKLFVTSKVVTKGKVLEELINRYLGIHKAKKENLDQNPVVKSKMEDVLYHAQLSKDLESQFAKISVTDGEVENYYKTNPEYRSAHILLRVRATPSTEEIKAALDRSMKIYRELKSKPSKFADLAAKYSQSENAETGGDIGYQPKVRLAPEYYRAIHNQPEGHISSPVRTQFGYHIIKNMGKLKYNAVDKNLYRKIVYDQKRDELISNYFDSLKKNATIKIEKKYLK